MERNHLKQLLISISKDDFRVPEDVNPYDLSLLMMDYIGDIDGELRDDLVLTTLWHWIPKGVLTKEEMRHILQVSIDNNHLFYGIGQIDDSVFTRTFSVLVASLCVSKHLEEEYLTEKELDMVFDKVISYYDKEIDLRGYIDGKGWAHGAAHGADALGVLARCNYFDHDKLLKILDAIFRKISINNYSYIHNEDERMISAVVAVLERKVVEKKEILAWIKSFAPLNKIGKYPDDMILEINVKNFLESLYFRLLDRPEYEIIVNTAKKNIREINSFLKRK